MTKVELDSADLLTILDLIREQTKPSPIDKLHKFSMARQGFEELKTLLTAQQWDAVRASLVKELTEDQ